MSIEIFFDILISIEINRLCSVKIGNRYISVLVGKEHKILINAVCGSTWCKKYYTSKMPTNNILRRFICWRLYINKLEILWSYITYLLKCNQSIPYWCIMFNSTVSKRSIPKKYNVHSRSLGIYSPIPRKHKSVCIICLC